MAVIGKDIAHAAALLREGSLIGMPTETVYGLAGNALDESAIVKIFETKRRPRFDPLIAHIANEEALHSLVTHIPESALLLMRAFWPGPLTMLFPKQDHVPDILTSGLDTMAIRMPHHPTARALLEEIDFPLAAPSANPFGYVSPTTAQHVEDQLGSYIPYILDGGPSHIGVESTIVGFEGELTVVYRLGGLMLEDLKKVVTSVKFNVQEGSAPQAPGMLKSHYAPTKKLIIGNIKALVDEYSAQDIGILSFQQDYGLPAGRQIILSANGDLTEAARNLFAAMRKMDAWDIDVILTERFPTMGLGAAINDRLKRAAVR